jgi:hypothetical protein
LPAWKNEKALNTHNDITALIRFFLSSLPPRQSQTLVCWEYLREIFGIAWIPSAANKMQSSRANVSLARLLGPKNVLRFDSVGGAFGFGAAHFEKPHSEHRWRELSFSWVSRLSWAPLVVFISTDAAKLIFLLFVRTCALNATDPYALIYADSSTPNTWYDCQTKWPTSSRSSRQLIFFIVAALPRREDVQAD